MNKKRIHRLFARFNGIYGGTWSGRFPTTVMYNVAVEEWGKDLDPFQDGEIEQAFQLCKQRYTTAPTLPQFLELVKAVHFRLHEKRFQSPPAKPVPPEVARRWIDEMRGILNGQDRQDAPEPGDNGIRDRV